MNANSKKILTLAAHALSYHTSVGHKFDPTSFKSNDPLTTFEGRITALSMISEAAAKQDDFSITLPRRTHAYATPVVTYHNAATVIFSLCESTANITGTTLTPELTEPLLDASLSGGTPQE